MSDFLTVYKGKDGQYVADPMTSGSPTVGRGETFYEAIGCYAYQSGLIEASMVNTVEIDGIHYNKAEVDKLLESLTPVRV